MNAKLRITFNQQMNMIGHDFQTHDLCLMFLANFCDDLFEPFVYPAYQDFASILWTKDHMVLARVVDIPIRFVRYCTHEDMYTAYCYLLSSGNITPPPKPP